MYTFVLFSVFKAIIWPFSMSLSALRLGLGSARPSLDITVNVVIYIIIIVKTTINIVWIDNMLKFSYLLESIERSSHSSFMIRWRFLDILILIADIEPNIEYLEMKDIYWMLENHRIEKWTEKSPRRVSIIWKFQINKWNRYST